jgi:uncharacterized membrane protein YqjE
MAMPDSDPEAPGVMSSVRGLARSLIGLMQTRVELFTVELQEEKLRAMRLMAWFAVAIALGVAGLLVAIAALALILWEMAGYGGLVGLVAGTLAAGAGILWRIRWQITHGPAPFAETAAEFRKDAESFREPS